MNVYKPLLLCVLLLIVISSRVHAENITRSNQAMSPVPDREVQVGIYVLNVGRFDTASGAFTADFYLSFTCTTQCPPLEYEFMNGRATSVDTITDLPAEKFYRIQAQLTSQVDLRRYPFDQQKMQISIEDKRSTIDTLLFVPNKEQSGIDKQIAFTGWTIQEWSAASTKHEYPVYNEQYSQYTFTIPISKPIFNSILKSLLPVIFIILVMLSSFLLDPDKITTRLGMVGSALVASVMFHVSLTNQIPPVSYLTFADKFMILNYFIILISFILNVTLLELHERKQIERVNKIHRLTEYTMIAIVFVAYTLLFIFFM